MGVVIHAEARFAARRMKADAERAKGNKTKPKKDPLTARLQKMVDKEKE